MTYIEREPLLEILQGLYDNHLTMLNYSADSATMDCIEAVIEAPTADVVEVVRCKDCAHKGAAFCMAGDFPLTKENENCYCSYGERREECKQEK